MMGLAVHRGVIALAGGGVTPTPPLDDYTTELWAAWSTRLLLTAYAGNLIRVKRSSDSAEQDIGQSGGALDTSALLTFCGAGDGVIVTYYDQSGNGRNGTSVNDFQKVVVSGSLQTLSSIPACVYGSGGASGGFLSSTKPTAISVFVTLSTSDANSVFITQQASEASDFRGVWQSGSAPGHGANGAYVNNVSVTNTRDDLYDAVAIGSPVVVSIHSTSTTWTGPNQMLLFGYGGAFALDGTVIDAVFYDASAVTDRADISTALEAAL